MEIEMISVKKSILEGCLHVLGMMTILELEKSNLPQEAVQAIYDVIEIVGPELDLAVGEIKNGN
tara:strand:+ start:1987 stop:2178 length:192 start_codon:yes stop_codon:yes gene_type:complete